MDTSDIGEVPLITAAEILAKRKRLNIKEARRYLIGAAAAGELSIWAGFFDFIVDCEIVVSRPAPAAIPASFWRVGHADHFDVIADARWPDGHCGDWTHNEFRSIGSDWGSIFLERWPFLENEAGHLRGENVGLEVLVQSASVDGLALERLAGQTNLSQMWRRLNEGLGRATRAKASEVEAAKARLVIKYLPGTDREAIAADAALARRLLRQMSNRQMSEADIRAFAGHLQRAAREAIGGPPPHPPSE